MQIFSPLLFRAVLVVLLFLVFSFEGVAQAPPFAWVKSAGGTYDDSGWGIAVDGSGSIYVTGSFQGTATFGNTTINSNGSHDMFIARYNASGNVLWAQKGGGTAADGGIGIAVDGSGNSYVTGAFIGTATFGSNTLINNGSIDMFVAKYDASGNVLWAQKAGGASNDVGHGVATDGSGNSYVTGSFYGTATFGSITLTVSGSGDGFIAKYDAFGNVLWVKKAGGIGADSSFGISTDGSGNSYITGYFEGSATFGSTTLNSGDSTDVFIAKYDALGYGLWVKKAGGTGNDFGYGIVIDGSGSSYVTGFFQGTATFDSTTLSSNGSYDIFIARYDASGNLLWAQKGGGTNVDLGRGIAVDGNNNSYVTGYFEGSATFGSTTLTSNGSYDMFIAKLGTITVLPCELISALPVLLPDTTLCLNRPFLLSTLSEFDSYYWNTGDTTAAITLTAPGTFHIKVIRQGCPFSDTITITEQCELLTSNIITPNGDGLNDAFIVQSLERNTLDLQVFNRWGQQVYSQSAYRNTWTGEGLADGIYFYQLQDQTTNTLYKGYIELNRE